MTVKILTQWKKDQKGDQGSQNDHQGKAQYSFIHT